MNEEEFEENWDGDYGDDYYEPIGDEEEFEVDEEWAEVDEISEWEFIDDDWR